jgi:hypothetical protein
LDELSGIGDEIIEFGNEFLEFRGELMLFGSEFPGKKFEIRTRHLWKRH